MLILVHLCLVAKKQTTGELKGGISIRVYFYSPSSLLFNMKFEHTNAKRRMKVGEFPPVVLKIK